ncbi:MAG: hypothetical protein U5R14_14945 [Gemmatimonadota bacterium]|nr:hypothetical protein [Gemmatimonadota bacterium]
MPEHSTSPEDRVVLRGAPGISLGSLLDGAPDLSGLLSLGASLPPLPDGAMGLPDWITPGIARSGSSRTPSSA